jgi:hypothetical protein
MFLGKSNNDRTNKQPQMTRCIEFPNLSSLAVGAQQKRKNSDIFESAVDDLEECTKDLLSLILVLGASSNNTLNTTIGEICGVCPDGALLYSEENLWYDNVFSVEHHGDDYETPGLLRKAHKKEFVKLIRKAQEISRYESLMEYLKKIPKQKLKELGPSLPLWDERKEKAMWYDDDDEDDDYDDVTDLSPLTKIDGFFLTLAIRQRTANAMNPSGDAKFIEDLPFGDVNVIKTHLENTFVNRRLLGRHDHNEETGQLNGPEFPRLWLRQFSNAVTKYQNALSVCESSINYSDVQNL